jgi:hypothetical protein
MSLVFSVTDNQVHNTPMSYHHICALRKLLRPPRPRGHSPLRWSRACNCALRMEAGVRVETETRPRGPRCLWGRRCGAYLPLAPFTFQSASSYTIESPCADSARCGCESGSARVFGSCGCGCRVGAAHGPLMRRAMQMPSTRSWGATGMESFPPRRRVLLVRRPRAQVYARIDAPRGIGICVASPLPLCPYP